MSNAKAVVGAFRTFRESTYSTEFTVGVEAISSTRENLVPISLMANIPDQLIHRSIEHIMKGNREFNDTQAGCKVTAMDTHHVNDEVTQFFTQFIELLPVKVP